MQTETLNHFQIFPNHQGRGMKYLLVDYYCPVLRVPMKTLPTKHGQLIAPGVNFTMLLVEAIEKMGSSQLSVTQHHWNLEKEQFVLGTNQMEVTSQILTSIPSCLFTGTQEGACQANVQRKTMRKRAMPCLSLDTHFSHSLPEPWKHIHATTLLLSPSIGRRPNLLKWQNYSPVEPRYPIFTWCLFFPKTWLVLVRMD